MVIPKLRFTEFSSNWKLLSLQKCGFIVSDGNYGPLYPKSEEFTEVGIPFIRAKNFKNGRITLEDMRFISEDLHSKLTSGHLEEMDVLVSTRGEIGTIAFVDSDFVGANINAQICLLRKSDLCKQKFLFYSLLTDSSIKQFRKLKTGSALKQLPRKNLMKIVIGIPSFKEQQKIADCLSSLDDLITAHSQKLDLLKTHKKGLMQQLFPAEGQTTPTLRFPEFQDMDGWKREALGKLSNISTGSSNREDSSLDGKYTFFDRSQDIRTSNIYLFDCEAIIVAGEGQDFLPKYFIGKFDLHQRSYAITSFEGAVGKYLLYYIHYFRRYFLSQAVGSTVKSLRLPMFQKMPIHLPKSAEQQKIADCLSSLDKLIKAQSEKLDALKAHKKGLMQQLFPSPEETL
ncbi:MAG: restriction endonuclease subunit S [Anaerolineaceae bacterium]|nr:restriction endonuclease subunit S [Anaerolineaceae bacterium]